MKFVIGETITHADIDPALWDALFGKPFADHMREEAQRPKLAPTEKYEWRVTSEPETD